MHPTISPLESIQYADMVLKEKSCSLRIVQALKSGNEEKRAMLPQISGSKEQELEELVPENTENIWSKENSRYEQNEDVIQIPFVPLI